jgi:hypothetical protein
MSSPGSGLLPPNATAWERLFASITGPERILCARFDDVDSASRTIPAVFLPHAVWQYGLEELTPYVPALYQLIDEGIRWQRVRGTPRAIEIGLGWIGYAGTLEEASVRRRRWNRFQVALSRVRTNELPDLGQIDGIVALSPPVRSKFARGFAGYDVRTAETGYRRLSGSIVGDDSGVYLPGIAAKWSFGRTWRVERTLGQSDLTPAGAWLPTVSGGGLWVEMTTPWVSNTALWALPAQVARRVAIAQTLSQSAPYIRFRSSGGSIIGHARAIPRSVKSALTGPYLFDTQRFEVTATETEALLIFARTRFGDGTGQAAASMSVVIGATLVPGVPLGRRWLSASDLTGGVELASSTVSIPFGQTVREHVQFLLRF